MLQFLIASFSLLLDTFLHMDAVTITKNIQINRCNILRDEIHWAIIILRILCICSYLILANSAVIYIPAVTQRDYELKTSTTNVAVNVAFKYGCLSHAQETPLKVKHIRVVDWPNTQALPTNSQTLLRVFQNLMKWRKQNDDKPILVHCW